MTKGGVYGMAYTTIRTKTIIVIRLCTDEDLSIPSFFFICFGSSILFLMASRNPLKVGKHFG